MRRIKNKRIKIVKEMERVNIHIRRVTDSKRNDRDIEQIGVAV